MFYVKNDDMEDLFKKAADEYEINDDLAADWNKVHAALQHDESGMVPHEKEKKRRRFIFFWWFLLIPAGLLIAYSTGFFDGKHTQQKQAAITKATEENVIIQKQNEQAKVDDSNNDKLTQSNNSDNSTTTKESNTSTQQQKDYSFNQVIEKNERLSSISINQNNNTRKQNNKSFNNDVADNKPDNNSNTSINNNVSTNNNTVSSNNNKNTNSNDEIVAQSENPVQQKNQEDLITKTDSVATKENNENSLVNKIDNKQNLTAKKNKSTNNDFTRQAYWITGVTANVDLSFVKNQHTSKLGYGGGIVAGYHLKNGLSFQTGLLFDKKNYYTSGEHFDTKNLKYFQTTGAKINYANGNCNMWEIPVNVSYDFKTRKQYNWFVTAGVSSYLMHNEYYDFNYELNNIVYDNGRNYPHSSKDYFSVLNLGAGANIQASKKMFIQVQPYFKVPLSGVGIGNLSLKSAGLNLSFVRHIH